MKRVIRAAFEEEYIPNLQQDQYTYLELLNDAIYERIGRRLKKLKVVFNPVEVTPNEMYVGIELQDKGDPVYETSFKFTAYDSYYDEVEFQSHVMRSIKTYVDKLYYTMFRS